MTYDAEEAAAVAQQDREDEKRRDYFDALQAAREQDAVMCSWCGKQIDEEPCEDGEEIVHHACYCQQENADALRKALASVSSDIAGKVSEYDYERTFGSASPAPEKDGAALRATAEAVTLLLDRGLSAKSIVYALHLLYDLERHRITTSPSYSQHTVGVGHPVLRRIMSAVNELEQIKEEER